MAALDKQADIIARGSGGRNSTQLGHLKRREKGTACYSLAIHSVTYSSQPVRPVAAISRQNPVLHAANCVGIPIRNYFATYCELLTRNHVPVLFLSHFDHESVLNDKTFP
jgi:hypothetical protein